MPRTPPAPKRRPRHSGSVGTRKDGRIFCTLPPDLDPARRPRYGPGHRRSFTSEAQAAAWLDAEVERRRNPSSARTRRSEPLGLYLARWWERHAPGWPDGTADAYRDRLVRWASIGHVPVGELTHEDIQEAIAGMQRRPYAASTIAATRAVLHQAIDELVPDVLPHNPVKRTRLGRSMAPIQPVWSAEQADRFLVVAERHVPQLALAWRLILRRGLRPGEVRALRWSDVDWGRHRLTIDETAGRRVGETGPTKSRRVRDVPLGTGELAALRAHQRAYPSTLDWIFHERGHAVAPMSLDRHTMELIRLSRLPALTLKDMRATCATVLLDQGVALPRVSALLGHASIATTSRFYARILERRSAEQAAELDAAFDRAGTETARTLSST